jgi:hypothetical protein
MIIMKENMKMKRVALPIRKVGMVSVVPHFG